MEAIMDAEQPYEQAQAILATILHQVQFFIHQLHIPNSLLYWTTARAALYDSKQAATSVAFWIFLTIRPVVLCIYWLSFYFCFHILYQCVLVQGIYHHGLSQGKEWLLVAWRWQCRLSQRQLCMEAAAMVLLYALYQLQQFLKRRRYLYKLHLHVDRKRRKIVKVRVLRDYVVCTCCCCCCSFCCCCCCFYFRDCRRSFVRSFVFVQESFFFLPKSHSDF